MSLQWSAIVICPGLYFWLSLPPLFNFNYNIYICPRNKPKDKNSPKYFIYICNPQSFSDSTKTISCELFTDRSRIMKLRTWPHWSWLRWQFSNQGLIFGYCFLSELSISLLGIQNPTTIIGGLNNNNNNVCINVEYLHNRCHACHCSYHRGTLPNIDTHFYT